jgi:hypothetical protein
MNGWNRLTIETSKGHDPREEIFRLAAKKNWSMREIRLETGGLEEFFVQITAQQLTGDKSPGQPGLPGAEVAA